MNTFLIKEMIFYRNVNPLQNLKRQLRAYIVCITIYPIFKTCEDIFNLCVFYLIIKIFKHKKYDPQT